MSSLRSRVTLYTSNRYQTPLTPLLNCHCHASCSCRPLSRLKITHLRYRTHLHVHLRPPRDSHPTDQPQLPHRCRCHRCHDVCIEARVTRATWPERYPEIDAIAAVISELCNTPRLQRHTSTTRVAHPTTQAAMAKQRRTAGRTTNRAESAATSVASSVVSSAVSSRFPSRASSPTPRQPFRFTDLPAELRLRIYELVLLMPEPLDLHSDNWRVTYPRFALFLVSHQLHEEAYRIFYAQPIRLFPAPSGRFFNTKKPLLARLPVRYREVITTVELRLGPGWSRPPRCQNVQPSLGLMDCKNLRTLRILVECDPSDSFFNGFRGSNATEETYKWFCVDLLAGILEQVPGLETVEIDAWVKKEVPIVTALKCMVEEGKKKLVWGPCLKQREVDDELRILSLASTMSAMRLAEDTPRLVEAHA